jgi:transposase
MAFVEVAMSSKRYTQEFKDEALKQISDRGHSIADVADRLGVSIHSLYAWHKHSGKTTTVRQVESDQAIELRRLKAELRRVTEERDILKKAAAYFAKQSA